MIDALRSQYKLEQLLLLFDIPKSSYWYQEKQLEKGDTLAEIREQILEIFFANDGGYGSERIHLELKNQNIIVSEKVVR